MGEGPPQISVRTASEINDELEAVDPGHEAWLAVRTELHRGGRQLVVFVDIPDNDPFEPSRLDRIFVAIEGIIVPRIPREIPLRDAGESWLVFVNAQGDRALIDGIAGGKKVARRTMRLSGGVGPPSR